MNDQLSKDINHLCPICNSGISQPYYEVKNDDKTYFVEKCLNCYHYYSSGYGDINTTELYNDDVYQVVDNRDSFFSKVIGLEAKNILKNIRSLTPQGKRLLDFGSGKGNFLVVAKQMGYQVIGIETAIKRAEFAEEKYGLKIIKSEYVEGRIEDEGFDVITLLHVLEHLPYPKELLSNLVKYNLNEGGLIVIEVPNLSSLQSGIAKNNWMHLDIPRHLSHFTRKRMIRFADESGLRIVKIGYFSFHLGLIGMCHSILTLFGYKGKIIRDLKHHNMLLIIMLLGILPIAFIMEIISAMFNRGGVIRLYCQISPAK